jgi:hypothetical protein
VSPVRTFGWIFTGVLGLAALEAIVATPNGAGRFADMLAAIEQFLGRVLDPGISAIPNLTGTDTSSPD